MRAKIFAITAKNVRKGGFAAIATVFFCVHPASLSPAESLPYFLLSIIDGSTIELGTVVPYLSRKRRDLLLHNQGTLPGLAPPPPRPRPAPAL